MNLLSKLNSSVKAKSIEPREIFMTLPSKAPGYGYPRDVQSEVWKKWFDIRDKKNVELPKDIVEKIKIFWQKQVEENPHLFNGEVWSVTKFEELKDRLRLTVQKTNYAHYLYDERVGLGGNLDQNDIKEDGTVDLIGNIARELQEELNLDLFDKSMIPSYKMQYMELPEGRRHAYSPKLKGFLKMTSEEMKEYYEKYKTYLKENNQEVEFAKIHFIDKENVVAELDALDNPKRPYLRGLLCMDSKEI